MTLRTKAGIFVGIVATVIAAVAHFPAQDAAIVGPAAEHPFSAAARFCLSNRRQHGHRHIQLLAGVLVCVHIRIFYVFRAQGQYQLAVNVILSRCEELTALPQMDLRGHFEDSGKRGETERREKEANGRKERKKHSP